MKYAVLVLVVVLLAGGYMAYSRTKSASAAAANVPDTRLVVRRDLEKLIPANGKVASNRDVDIKCQASGTIKELPYQDVSKEVKPGELLCQLDPIDMERQLTTAKAVVDADISRITEAKLNRDISKMALETQRQRDEAALASSTAQAADADAKADRTRQLYETKPTALASKEELDTTVTTAAQAHAAVENAKAAISELEQQKIQISTKEQQIKQMEAALAQDQARLDTAQQNVGYCAVFAPKNDNAATDPPRWFISSLLTNIAPGYIVQSGTSGFSAGTTIMTLSDLSHVFVLASVDESDIGQVLDPARGDKRQKVRTTADSFSGQVFEGEVVRVATKGVNTSNVVTFEVKIEVTSPNRTLLRPEMTTTSNIIYASRPDVLVIPAAAFVKTQASDASPDVAVVPVSLPASAPADAAATSQPATTRSGKGAKAGRPGAVPDPNKVVPQDGTVIVMENGVQKSRNVTVGMTDGENYEVLKGLQEGDEVVLNKSTSDSRWRGQNNPSMRGMPRTGR